VKQKRKKNKSASNRKKWTKKVTKLSWISTQGSVPPLAQASDTRPITRIDTDDMARCKLSKHDSTSEFGEEEQSKEKMSDIEDEK
jgi:hypothetical protein